MPQPILRHIARRAVQVAIVAAGILVVLLVFSRQAHAATSPTSPPAPEVRLLRLRLAIARSLELAAGLGQEDVVE